MSHSYISYLKQKFITRFLTEFQKNKVSKNQFFKKQVLEKRIFTLEKIFYQNMVLIYLVLTYDHTPVIYSPRTLFCIYLSKNFYWKNIDFKKIFKIRLLTLSGRPHGRPLAEQNCSVGRPGGRLTCTNVHVCTLVDRPGRPEARAVLSVFSGRPTRSTDKEYHSLFWLQVDRPVDRFPNGRKSDHWRSTARSTDSRETC